MDDGKVDCEHIISGLMKKLRKQQGFTLIEVMLIAVLLGIIFFTINRQVIQRTEQAKIDLAVQQMQQILNASLAFYIANGQWPPYLPGSGPPYCLLAPNTYTKGNTSLQICTTQYLVPNAGDASNPHFYSPWGTDYQTYFFQGNPDGSCQAPNTLPNEQNSGACQSQFVILTIPPGPQNIAYANAIAGRLPQAYITGHNPLVDTNYGFGGGPPQVCDGPTQPCYVVASVMVPGQDPANATSINFAGLYHHGACVPVPLCPPNTTPQIIVQPVSISGLTSTPNIAGGSTPNVFPISSFTGYAVGGPSYTPSTVPACTGTTSTAPVCGTGVNPNNAPNFYWRVCAQIVTQAGTVASSYTSTTNLWGQYVTLMAMTRCSVSNEPAGSNYTTIFSN